MFHATAEKVIPQKRKGYAEKQTVVWQVTLSHTILLTKRIF